MKRVTLVYRKLVNAMEQDGRVVTAIYTRPDDDHKGTVKPEVIECEHAHIDEFCVHIKDGHPTVSPSLPGRDLNVWKSERAIPLDLLFNIKIEEVS